ncbi:Glu-tRNA(Gln) amidotransferase subunit GatD [Candidatus Nitrosopelagicus sp.]|nr:Glu-tRNA(Gln) amidotransferase subunit GatD [Candidatus Nitrosopelagicus sp.]
MADLKGYRDKSLELLNKNNIEIGDLIKIIADLSYTGILMPRYETSQDSHIVLKLKSGYNIGIELEKIEKIEKISSAEKPVEVENVKKTNSDLPKILLLSTGGTIASTVDYRTGAVTPALTASDLNDAVPEISKIANVDAQVLFSEYSENLQPEHWIKTAQKINGLANSDYKGIIIAHGTDTMHYSSAFLSFALSGFPIPIVLVGSQRSSDRPSSDAAVNLLAAIRFAVNVDTNGVFIVMHHNDTDDAIACHFGTRVRKNHTSKRSAFKTIGNNPAFIINEDKIMKNEKKEFFTKKEYNPKLQIDTKVALVKYYPGYDPEQIDHLIESGYKAIIFEGTGLGHIGNTMYNVVKKANEKGLFLGMTSQCIDGRIRMTVYESGRDLMDLGITPLQDIIPEVALVKAMWALGNSEDIEGMKKLMLQNTASEFTE